MGTRRATYLAEDSRLHASRLAKAPVNAALLAATPIDTVLDAAADATLVDATLVDANRRCRGRHR